MPPASSSSASTTRHRGPSPSRFATPARRCDAPGHGRLLIAFPAGAPLPVAARAWVEAAAVARFARQVVLGDVRALAPALEGAARDLGIAVEVTRVTARVEPPPPTA